MKRLIIAVLLLLALCGCLAPDEDSYPKLIYQHSSKAIGREIALGDGYILNQGNMYSMIETENGYDLVLHFVKEDTDVH